MEKNLLDVTEPHPVEFTVPGRRLLVDRQTIRIGELESLLSLAQQEVTELRRIIEWQCNKLSLMMVKECDSDSRVQSLEALLAEREARLEMLEWEVGQQQQHTDDTL